MNCLDSSHSFCFHDYPVTPHDVCVTRTNGRLSSWSAGKAHAVMVFMLLPFWFNGIFLCSKISGNNAHCDVHMQSHQLWAICDMLYWIGLDSLFIQGKPLANGYYTRHHTLGTLLCNCWMKVLSSNKQNIGVEKYHYFSTNCFHWPYKYCLLLN